MKFKTLDEQWLLISRGVEEILPEDALKVKLKKSISSKTPCLLYTSDAADE